MQTTTAATGSMRAKDARADGAVRDISFARGEILIRRRVGGIEMKVGVPAANYRGVVLSLVDLADGRVFYRIALCHRDPDLNITLHEAHDDRDIVAEWKFWAKRFCLPKFIEREPGRLEGAERMLGPLTLGRRGQNRRRGAALSKRRPRAPLRRKPGARLAAPSVQD
jgi:hypothetical protein